MHSPWYVFRKFFESERISYQTHKLLDNEGPTIKIDEILTKDTVSDILTSNQDIPRIVHKNRMKIYNALQSDAIYNSPEFMTKICGIFIHDSKKGLVMLEGKSENCKQTVSILI